MQGYILFVIISLVGIYIFIVINIATLISNDLPIIRFKKALVKAIKYDTLNSIDDVHDLYYGAKNSSSINNYRQNLNKIIKRLIYEKNYSLESKKVDIDETKKILEKLKSILDDNEKISIFSELPPQEKALFEDVSNYLNHKDLDAAKNKMNEISNLFVILNEKKLKADKLAKLSFGLAIASTAITIYSLFQ